jgi:hypothetical protein
MRAEVTMAALSIAQVGYIANLKNIKSHIIVQQVRQRVLSMGPRRWG